MKKFLFFISFGFFIFLTSCATPQPGSYAWSKKYANSGIAKHHNCGASKGKKPKWAKVKYTNAKKSNKKKK